jgi:hypothetical protein
VLEVLNRTQADGVRGASDDDVSRTKETLRHFLSNLQEQREVGDG